MQNGRFRLGTIALLLLTGTLCTPAQAQTQVPGDQAAPPQAAAAHSVRTAVERWVDLQAAIIQARYRRVESSADTVLANHMQDSLLLRGRIKFDAKGHYALTSSFQTGPTFTGSWNNVGWGTGGPRTTGIYLKHLFLTAAPVTGLEVSYGSIGFVRGEASEITTYDNDGYMLGGRVTVRRPKTFFLDDISYSQGFFGDPAEPAFSDRYSNFGVVNFHQVVGIKRFGRLFAFSGDYTNQDSAGTVRAAARLRTPRMRVIDGVRYEHYCRVERLPACGLAATVDKTLGRRVTVGGGYANVDPDFGGVNGDRYTRGQRVFEQVTVRVFRDVTVSGFATQAFHNSFAIANNRRVDLVVAYNALGPIRRAGWFR